MNGCRHLSSKPRILLQVRIRDAQASHRRTWDLAHISLGASRGWWAFLGETWHSFVPTACPSSACQAGFMVGLEKYTYTKHSHDNNAFFFFFLVCFNIFNLKLSQGLQVCMSQPEVTLRSTKKLKNVYSCTFSYQNFLSEQREAKCKNTPYALQKPFLLKKEAKLKSKHMAFE